MDLSKDAIPYPVVERRWSEAILLQAWDDKEDIPFETVVRTEDDLEIFFLPKTASSMKRQIIKKICEALDYEARFLESD